MTRFSVGGFGPAAAASIASLRRGGVRPDVITPVDLAIPENYADGAVIYRAQPVSGTAVSFSVPENSGISVSPSGVVIIEDNVVALAALPKKIDVTIVKDVGLEIVRLNLSSIVNFIDLSPYADNISFWMDVLDNRFLQVTGDGQTVQEVADKVVSDRKARNDLYSDRRPLYLTSPINANRKAIRFAPSSDTVVYGLFFQESPISDGVQRLSLASSSIQARHDLKYKANTPGQAGAATTDFPNVSHSLTANAPALLTIVGVKATGVVTFYKNGAQIGSPSAGWSLNYDFVTFVLLYPEAISGQAWSNGALGQSYIWKQGPYKGYFFEVVQFLGATLSP